MLSATAEACQHLFKFFQRIFGGNSVACWWFRLRADRLLCRPHAARPAKSHGALCLSTLIGNDSVTNSSRNRGNLWPAVRASSRFLWISLDRKRCEDASQSKLRRPSPSCQVHALPHRRRTAAFRNRDAVWRPITDYFSAITRLCRLWGSGPWSWSGTSPRCRDCPRRRCWPWRRTNCRSNCRRRAWSRAGCYRRGNRRRRRN
jgi:hypothetical protein